MTAVIPANSTGRILVASLGGTAIEYYDFFVYATASVLVFPKLFFANSGDPIIALLTSFAVFGVAFIARPIGAALFGHFGDRLGRKGTLVAALLTMGIATFAIGVLPTGQTPGWAVAAPAILVILRFIQGIGLGGEWAGAAVFATENAPEARRTLWGTFPIFGAPLGFIAGNGLFLLIGLLDGDAFFAWGWRIPFLLSAVLVVIGFYARLKLTETTAFRRVSQGNLVARAPLASVFSRYLRSTVVGTLIMLVPLCAFFLTTTFMLTVSTTPTTAATPGLGLSMINVLIMQLIGVAVMSIFIYLSVPLTNRYGRRPLLIWATLGLVVLGLLFAPMLSLGAVGVAVMLLTVLPVTGLVFGPMGAILSELFPANVRYTGAGVSFNLGALLGGSLAPFIAVALWQAGGGSPVLIGLYLSAMAVLSFIGLLLYRPSTKDVSFGDNLS